MVLSIVVRPLCAQSDHPCQPMGEKRKATTAAADDAAVDWLSYARRPFKRGFIPYAVRTSTKEAARRRTSAGIEIVKDLLVDATPAPLEAFEELGVLPPWSKDALSELQCLEPTPIQAQALPICIAGYNLIGQAPPGSGQALAFLLPSIVHVEDQPPLEDLDPGPIVLALAPTRELAAQLTKEASRLLAKSIRSVCHPGGMRAVCLHEGGNRKEQLKQLGPSGSHIVIGTPGRVHALASKDQLPLLRVTFLVLEELDRILELGQGAEVRAISSWVRPERQVAIFSATWPKEASILASELCNPSGVAVHVSANATAWESALGDENEPGEFPEQW